jgi:hypothetical protein
MRILTPAEWQSWCGECGVPLRESGWVRPDISVKSFHIETVPYPAGSGSRVSLARVLLSLVEPEPETLLLVDDWAVWPSCQHMPLFTRFREALGEHRPLIEAPGHLVTAADGDDALSIVATSLLFLWDCYGISSSGRDAFYVSHDEFCYFASRDPSVTARVREQLAANMGG